MPASPCRHTVIVAIAAANPLIAVKNAADPRTAGRDARQDRKLLTTINKRCRRDATVGLLPEPGKVNVMPRPDARDRIDHSPRAASPPGMGWNQRLLDGTLVHIRPIRKQDAGLELEFLNRLSPGMRSLRFLGLIQEPCPDVARGLTDLDPRCAAGFIAVVSDGGRERQIGAAHFHVSPKGDSCDCSVTVSDEWQKRGVGSSLMHVLIDAARQRGIRHLRAFAPAQSGGSHRLASRLGFKRHLDLHDPSVEAYHLELT
jgi:acetyltransferase